MGNNYTGFKEPRPFRQLLQETSKTAFVSSRQGQALVGRAIFLAYLARAQLKPSTGMHVQISSSRVEETLKEAKGSDIGSLPLLGLEAEPVVNPFNKPDRRSAPDPLAGWDGPDLTDPTTRMYIFSRRATFLQYRNGLAEFNDSLPPAQQIVITSYLQGLVHWAKDWSDR